MDVSLQLADWRTLAGRLLATLVPQISGSRFTAQDELADDLLRSLTNQPPRPAGRDPYVGVLGTGTVPTLRAKAGNGIRFYLERSQAADLVPADTLSDRLIRVLRNFPTQLPGGVLPYEAIFGYTRATYTPEQIFNWRRQAGSRLQFLVLQQTVSEPVLADNLADALLRALTGQAPRPSDRRPYEGLFVAPAGTPFLALRQRGADGLKLFVAAIQDPRLGSKDAVIDHVIRQMTPPPLPNRPISRLPYEGLFPAASEPTSQPLSQNFTVADLTRSQTARDRNIDNTPGPTELEHLRRLCQQILQPTWNALGPLFVTSGYRSPTLNAAVGGVTNSDHLSGYAADIVPRDSSKFSTRQIAEWIVKNLPFDQVILERGTEQNPDWIHVSASPTNRRQVLRDAGNGAVPYAL